MNLSALSQRALGTAQLYWKKNGATILTGTGVVGLVGTAVLAGRGAVKFEPERLAMKEDLYSVDHRDIADDYTKQDKVKDYGTIVVNGAKEAVKCYAPALIVGGLSITAIISAHGMLKKQNMALVAAYGVLDLGFKQYRERVAELIGEDKEKDLYRGVESRKMVKDEATGQPCEIVNFHDKTPSLYAKYFDESNPNFSRTPDFNHAFLKGKQNYFNNKLQAKGYLFLNEVYSELGFKETQPGQVVGWLANGDGDGYVDFGIFDVSNDISRAFVNGLEEVVLIEFNVDGVILDKFSDR